MKMIALGQDFEVYEEGNVDRDEEHYPSKTFSKEQPIKTTQL